MTCNIWTKNSKDELEPWEWEKILSQIGSHVKFYTFGGGEPFIRDDLPEFLFLPFKYGNPYYLTLSTNCLFPEKVRNHLEVFFEMLKEKSPRTKIHCNLSVDGIGDAHDKVRGVEGNFEKVLKTIEYLKEIRDENKELRIGIHTVISKFNLDEIDKVYEYFFWKKYIDSVSYVIAERRYELLNEDQNLTPSVNEFRTAILPVLKRLSKDKKLRRTFKSLHISYYGFIDKWLTTNRQSLPCFGGRASCHLTPDGKVVACGARWIEDGLMGDIRETNYDFKTIWRSPKAISVRKSIRNYECTCSMLHNYYSTLVCNPISWPSFLSTILKA